jgi:hypothetical protein
MFMLIVLAAVIVGFAVGWLAASSTQVLYGPALRRAAALIDDLEREAMEASDVDLFARAQLDRIRQYRRKELE